MWLSGYVAMWQCGDYVAMLLQESKVEDEYNTNQKVFVIRARGTEAKLKETPGLRRHGDERTCQQVLCAKHLLTTSVFQQF